MDRKTGRVINVEYTRSDEMRVFSYPILTTLPGQEGYDEAVARADAMFAEDHPEAVLTTRDVLEKRVPILPQHAKVPWINFWWRNAVNNTMTVFV